MNHGFARWYAPTGLGLLGNCLTTEYPFPSDLLSAGATCRTSFASAIRAWEYWSAQASFCGIEESRVYAFAAFG
ncbi:hypothetical protein EDD90_3786 [Streptomyces sp. Ag109_O5-1]|nr:hypothetical protein EDD90_3786 [Streptomyces sp. Ag109_O5-1]